MTLWANVHRPRSDRRTPLRHSRFRHSIITDLGVEGKIQEVSHEEVQEAANAVQPLMADIMREMIVRSC